MVEARSVDYRIPGANQVALSHDLAGEIRQRFRADRENRFQLYLLAAGLRQRYLNPKTNAYEKAFSDWYETEQLKDLFGSVANFTKYASAGEVVAYVSASTDDPEKFLRQLPVSVGALYECSQVLGLDKTVFDLCLRFTAKRKTLDAQKHEWATTKPPLIRPTATEAQIRTWRRKWTNPPPPKLKRTDKRTLPLAVITVSGELFDFDKKTGDKLGCVDLPEVEAFLAKVATLFGEDNAVKFKIEDSLDYLTEGYYKRRDQYDPARNILSAKRKPAKSKYK